MHCVAELKALFLSALKHELHTPLLPKCSLLPTLNPSHTPSNLRDPSQPTNLPHLISDRLGLHSRELERGSDDEEKSGGDDPLAGIPLTSYSQQDYAREAPGRVSPSSLLASCDLSCPLMLLDSKAWLLDQKRQMSFGRGDAGQLGEHREYKLLAGLHWRSMGSCVSCDVKICNGYLHLLLRCGTKTQGCTVIAC